MVVAYWPSYSYSESIAPYYGYTGNAAADNALRWSMSNVFPDPPGLFVDNVIYSYKIQKETGELVTVYVYNENANGTGYVFREKDEWRPGSLSGTQINKVVPLGRLHRDVFGDGGIDVDGNGSVYDANVVYTYKVDPCYNPQFDPNCPGYEMPMPNIYEPQIDIYDATANGDANLEQYNPDDELYEDEEQLSDEERAKLEEEEEKDSKERLEEALFEAGRAALFAQALSASQLKDSTQISMNSYYAKSIPGGEYKDNVVLNDRQLPDAKNGLRNGLAQQILHQQMVEMQYNKK